MQNKVLLSWVVQHLSKTAADANDRLTQDYLAAAKKINENGNDDLGFIAIPPPLVITNMKMKFSANISRGDKTLGGDMMLEFGKHANFHGEIELKPYESNPYDLKQSDAVYNQPEQYLEENDEGLNSGYEPDKSSESIGDIV